MQSVYADTRLTKLKSQLWSLAFKKETLTTCFCTACIASAEVELRIAIIHVDSLSLQTQRSELVLDRSPTVLETSSDDLLRRLGTIEYLSQSIQEQIRPIHVVATAASVL